MRTLPLPNFGEKSFFFSKSALNTCVLHLTLISQFFVKSKLMTFPISHLNLDELLCSIIFDQILVKLWIKSPIFDYIILWRKPYYFGCFWGINNNCLDVKSGHPKAEIVETTFRSRFPISALRHQGKICPNDSSLHWCKSYF